MTPASTAINLSSCLNATCRSPVACGAFGYCREHNIRDPEPTTPEKISRRRAAFGRSTDERAREGAAMTRGEEIVERLRQVVRDEVGSQLCGDLHGIRCHGDRPVCLCRSVAEAVAPVLLDAIAEPSEGMMLAACHGAGTWRPADDTCWLPKDAAADAWRAMIAALRKEIAG